MKYLKNIIHRKRNLAIFITLFAVIGAVSLIISRAATPTLSIEPETGTIQPPATSIDDTSASGGKAVKFSVATSGGGVSSDTPCVGASAPSQWKHIIVVMFENHTWSEVVGSSSPYITGLINKCGAAYSGSNGTTQKNNWHDGNFNVDGTTNGNYNSKPSYATLTNGLSPTVHGLTDDTYSTTTSVDNIYKQLIASGKNGKDYYSGSASSTPCSGSNFSGAYHDAIRYYTPTIGSAYCNSHDVPISTFMNDVNGTLPEFSLILPTNGENMHDNSVSSGDTWAKNFLNPIFDSARYKSGDTAVFFLFDEETPIPNALVAPSIKPGSKVPSPSGNPISHFSATRTWTEMLGLPPLGVSGQAPSLLSFFNGQ